MSHPNNLNNRQLAAQCIFPKLDTEKFFEMPEYRSHVIELINLGVGGFCIFSGNTVQVEQMVNELQNIAELPLMFVGDFEYGLPMRLSEGNEFPHAMALGNSTGHNTTFKIAQAISREIKSLGLHMNLAPVADINSNYLNPIINIRSFGDNPEIVSKNVVEFIQGSRSECILSCAKHFPGHGDTIDDSHIKLPTVAKSLSELEEFEFIPFKTAIEAGVEAIMVGHIFVPAMYNHTYPASLSKQVYDFLRLKLGFTGLTITDALDMRSITSIKSSGQATIESIRAGADIALMPEDAITAVNTAITEVDLDESFRQRCFNAAKRIINVKRKANLIPRYAVLETSKQVFTEHLNLALNVSHKALKIKNEKRVFPLSENVNFAAIAFLQQDKDLRTATRFFTMLSQAIENDCDFGFVSDKLLPEELNSMKDGIKDAKILIFAVFLKAVAYDGRTDLYIRAADIFEKLNSGKKTIVIFFGNPYFADIFEADAKIWTFSDSFPSLASVVIELSGRKEALTLL